MKKAYEETGIPPVETNKDLPMIVGVKL